MLDDAGGGIDVGIRSSKQRFNFRDEDFVEKRLLDIIIGPYIHRHHHVHRCVARG